MSMEVVQIALNLPLGMGAVNCYLLKTPGGCVLIDSGVSMMRRDLLRRLESEGCTAQTLRLVILTHGDFDHTGSAAHLRRVFGTPLGMHRDDAGMVEQGDMFFNRKRPNAVVCALIPLFTGFGRAQRFSPDVLLKDGQYLAPYGVEGRVLSLPGHSRGSIGVLTAEGALFCGDLLDNMKQPALNSIMDDPAAGQASLARLRGLGVGRVYPGHGQPFPFEALQG